MQPFAYAVAPSAEAAIAHAGGRPDVEYIAGGTDMLQLLQEQVRRPAELVDLTPLPLRDITVDTAGARIGALARMADVADDPRMQAQFPAVVEALLASA